MHKKLLRPGKTDTLVEDCSKTRKTFGFNPRTRYKDIVKIMVEHDMEEVEHEFKIKNL